MSKLNERLTLFANLSVIVGIFFLAVEVRVAGSATQLQTIESVNEGWVGLNEAIVSDPQVARALIVGLYNPTALSDAEAAQFSMFLRMFTNLRSVSWRNSWTLPVDSNSASPTPGGRASGLVRFNRIADNLLSSI